MGMKGSTPAASTNILISHDNILLRSVLRRVSLTEPALERQYENPISSFFPSILPGIIDPSIVSIGS